MQKNNFQGWIVLILGLMILFSILPIKGYQSQNIEIGKVNNGSLIVGDHTFRIHGELEQKSLYIDGNLVELEEIVPWCVSGIEIYGNIHLVVGGSAYRTYLSHHIMSEDDGQTWKVVETFKGHLKPKIGYKNGDMYVSFEKTLSEFKTVSYRITENGLQEVQGLDDISYSSILDYRNTEEYAVNEQESDPDFTVTQADDTTDTRETRATKEWGYFLVCNGEASGIEDLLEADADEMVEGGSSANHWGIVLFDDDGTGLNEVRVVDEGGGSYTSYSMANVGLPDEPNLGDPDTFVIFLDWALTNYPVEHMVWDNGGHGGGTDGAMYDENPQDKITMDEAKYMNDQFMDVLGRPINVSSWDECIMQTQEWIYNYKPSCDYVAASMDYIAGEGYNYVNLMDFLYSSRTVEEVANEISEDYAREVTTEGMSTVDYDSWDYNFWPEFNSYLQNLRHGPYADDAEAAWNDAWNAAGGFGTNAPNHDLWELNDNLASDADLTTELQDQGATSRDLVWTANFNGEAVLAKYGDETRHHGIGDEWTTDSTYQMHVETIRDELASGEDGISNAIPTCAISAPNEGEQVSKDSSYTISGTAGDSDGSVESVQVKINREWWQTATGTTDWSFSWDVPSDVSYYGTGSYKVWARSYDGTDYSDWQCVNVTVTDTGGNSAPSVDLTRPDGGETFDIGTTETIWWNMSDAEDANTDLVVDLYYSTDGGSVWTAIDTGLAGTANPNTYDWLVPDDPSTNCLVRVDVTDTASSTASDTSASTFTIAGNTAPSVDLTRPDGGEIWTQGDVETIWWNMSDSEDANTDLTCYLNYSTDSGSTWSTITTVAGTANPNTYDWTVPTVDSTNCLVNIDVVDTGGLKGSDVSASTFTIQPPNDAPSVDLTRPDGGEVWNAGDTETIWWNMSDSEDANTDLVVDLYYSTDGGSVWTAIDTGLAGTANPNTYDWLVPDDPSTNCLVRVDVTDTASSTTSDQSASTFEIVGIPPGAPSGLTVEHYGITSTESNDTASSDAVNTGTVLSGDYTSTQTQDDVYHQIQEEQTGGGGPQVRYGLEVVYSVDIAADSNGPYTLNIDAYRDDTEDYPVEYQVDGGGYNAFSTITSGTDTDSYLSGGLSGVGAGSVVDIRITDTSGTGGENQGTLYVDHLYINSTGESSSGTDDNAVNWTASPDDGAGADDVVQYEIYRADTQDGLDSASVYDTVTADDSADYSYIDSGAGTADSTLWWYRVRAVDLDGLNSIYTSDVQEPGAAYDVHDLGVLSSSTGGGWNFVSFNLTADGDNYAVNNDLVEILEDAEYGIPGNYDKVMYYSAVDQVWKTYVPGRLGHYNDLSTWNNNMGIWIHMTADAQLQVEGTAPTTTDIQLYAGWNMVSYPSSTASPSDTELPGEVTNIGYFDSGQTYNIAYTTPSGAFDLNPGDGYWLYAESPVLWTVSY